MSPESTMLSGYLNLSVSAVHKRFAMRLAEWHLSIAMLLAGVMLLLPGETFSLDHYSVLRQTWSEDTWGWILTTIGSLRVIVLAINGALPRGSPHLRAALAAASSSIWAVMLIGYLFSPVPSLISGFMVSAMLTEWISVYRAAASARSEDEQQRERANGRAG